MYNYLFQMNNRLKKVVITTYSYRYLLSGMSETSAELKTTLEGDKVRRAG